MEQHPTSPPGYSEKPPPAFGTQVYPHAIPMQQQPQPMPQPQPQPQPMPQPQYAQPVAPVVVTQTVEKKPNAMRSAIPALPLALAIIYAILNFLIPGFGTILAGFSVLCCGNVGQSGGGRVGTFCINFWVGILQMLLTAIFLIGWIWSIIWGVALITIAASPNKKTTTTTVVTQGAPGGAHVVAVST